MNINPIQKLVNSELKIAEDMWSVFQRSYQIEADLIGTKDFPPLKRTAGDLQSSPTEFYGLIKEEILAAVIEIDRTEDLLEVCSLVVDPDFFRQGMAGKLIDFVLATFNPGLSIVETAAVNIPAITLYQKKGYLEEKKWMTAFGIEKIKLVRQAIPSDG